jgi:hypothetical protein
VSDNFAPRRLGLLLRNDIVGGYRTFLIQSAAIALFIVWANAMNAYFNAVPPDRFFWFSAVLLVWGAAVASRAFSELHDRTKNESFLLLPASALEKTLARLLLIMVGFFVYVLVFATAVSLLSEMLNLLAFGERNEFFQPFDRRILLLVGHFIVLQSLFFLGAAWFRKAHFWKTALSIILISFAYFGLAALLGFLLFHSYVDSYGVRFDEGEIYGVYLARMPLIDFGADAAKFAYYFVLPPFCWFVAWLRVRETQVSYGV